MDALGTGTSVLHVTAAVVLTLAEARSIGLVAALALERDLGMYLLLFVGIHNAWHAVTYIATKQPRHREGGTCWRSWRVRPFQQQPHLRK